MDKLQIEFENGIPILKSGKLLDNEFKNDVTAFLGSNKNGSGYVIVLDLGAAEIVYSYGISAIQDLCDSAEEANGIFALCGVSKVEVSEVLEISALLDRCAPHIYKDRTAAISALANL
ncbi:MAG: hypothetical protein ACRBF0_15305 [Calditrichia bacterium]